MYASVLGTNRQLLRSETSVESVMIIIIIIIARKNIQKTRSSRNLFQYAYRCGTAIFSSYTYKLQLLDCFYQTTQNVDSGFWSVSFYSYLSVVEHNVWSPQAAAIWLVQVPSKCAVESRLACFCKFCFCHSSGLLCYSVKTFLLKVRVQPIYFCIAPNNVYVTNQNTRDWSLAKNCLIWFGNVSSGFEENYQNPGCQNDSPWYI